jgi:hypothetical protein
MLDMITTPAYIFGVQIQHKKNLGELIRNKVSILKSTLQILDDAA